MGLVVDWTTVPRAVSALQTMVYLNPELSVVKGGTYDIIKALAQWRVLSEVEVAATALFMFDYVLTMGMEINLVWAAKWNWIKLLYLAQRYTPFIDAGFITIYRHVGTEFARERCERMTMVTGVLTIAGTIASELLLTIRVWAIWNRGMKFGIALLIGFIGVWIPACIAGYLYTGSLVYPESPPYSGFRGCFIMSDKPLVVWCWACLLLWDLVCLILVAIPASYSYRSGLASSPRLTYVVYRDGTVYYVFLFAISVVNIVFSSRLPASCRVVTMSMTRCLHSALASRVLLQLREQIEAEPSDTLAMGTEMSLDMMGTTTHAIDEDVLVARGGHAYGYNSRSGGVGGVDSISRARGPLRRGVGSENGLGLGDASGAGAGGLAVHVPERRISTSKRHSATPTVTSSVE